jgi:hypothetical protein
MTKDIRKRLGYSEHVEVVGRFSTIAAEKAVVVVVTSLAIHQICQIMFRKTDGSIFVQTPYFRKRSGIVAHFNEPEGISGSRTYHYQDSGKVTSHLVKLSHHPDGRVHFSQDGKVRTEIIRQSFPLAESIGPVFELHAFFLGGFQTITWAEKNRAYLPFVITNGLPFGVTVTGQWRRKEDLLNNSFPAGGSIGPISEIVSRKTGMKGVAYFLAQPSGFPLRDHVLMIECAPAALPSGVDRETVILMGGWDPTEIKDGEAPRKQTGFLSAMYPVESPEELSSRIGTIDLGLPSK